MRSSKLIVSTCVLAAFSGQSKIASAQLLGSMSFNQEVGAENDSEPGPHGVVTDAVSTVVPFQKTISANNGNGAYSTATYSLTDNGTVASINIMASGEITANGNVVAEASTNPPNTTFQLLQPCDFTAIVSTTGFGGSDVVAYDGYTIFLSLATAGSPSEQTGELSPGLINFHDTWGIGYNDPPQPANESGTYSLTLTFTAIPEPSTATLIAIPAAFALSRRRRQWRPACGCFQGPFNRRDTGTVALILT